MKTDICLVNAVGRTMFDNDPHIGISSLSSVLKNQGYKVEIVHLPYNSDYNQQIRTLVDRIRAVNPRVVGFSLFFTNYYVSKKAAEQLKDPVTIAGGPTASSAYREILKDTDAFDFIFRGYADRSLPEFMRRLREGSPGDSDGVVYGNGYDVVEKPISFVDVSKLGAGDEEYILSVTKKSPKKSPRITLDVSRGDCDGGCIFCQSKYLRRTYQDRNLPNKKPVKQVISEMRKFRLPESVYWFEFNTEDIMKDIDYFYELIEAIEKDEYPTLVRFEISPRSVVKHPEAVKRLFSTDVIRASINLGFQAGSDSILKKLRTGTTIEMNNEALEIILNSTIHDKQGFVIIDYFEYPHPDMTVEEYGENMITLDSLVERSSKKNSRFRLALYDVFTPLPNTALFEMMVQRGEKPDPNLGFTIKGYRFSDPRVQEIFDTVGLKYIK